MKAKVIKAFKERYQNMRLYNIDDDYEVEDENRAKYLESQGYLEIEESTSDDQGGSRSSNENKEPVDIEVFSSLSAAEQKQFLSDLGIEGDYGNEEKRKELYESYLNTGKEGSNGDSNA